MITKKRALEIGEDLIEDGGAFMLLLDKAGAFDDSPSRPHAAEPLNHDTADLIDILLNAGAVRNSRDALDVIAAFHAAGVTLTIKGA
jgi:hypothetical protein